MFVYFQYQFYEKSRVQTLGVKHKVLGEGPLARLPVRSVNKRIIWPSDTGIMLLLSKYFTSTPFFGLKVYGNHSASTLVKLFESHFSTKAGLGPRGQGFEAGCDDLVSSSYQLPLFYHRK
jgi:hypothetical protein